MVPNADIFLTFNWMGQIEKEIKVFGTLEKMNEQEMEHFFKSKESNSKTGSWTSNNGGPIDDQELEKKLVPLYGEINIKESDPNWQAWRFIPENMMVFTKR